MRQAGQREASAGQPARKVGGPGGRKRRTQAQLQKQWDSRSTEAVTQPCADLTRRKAALTQGRWRLGPLAFPPEEHFGICPFSRSPCLTPAPHGEPPTLPVAWPAPSHAQSGYQFPTGLPARPGREVPESPGQLLRKVAQPPWLRQEAGPASLPSLCNGGQHP